MTAKPKKQPTRSAGARISAGGTDMRFDFNAAAKRAQKDHPELRGNMLFIHAGEVAPDAHADDLVAQGVDDDDIAEVEKMVRDAKRLKTSFHLAVSREEKKNLGVLVFHPDRHAVFGEKPGAADDVATFDHETGHALLPKFNGTKSENAADGFAALRHFQRFDADARANLEYAGWKRAAVAMLLGKNSHLTTFTLDKIICDADTANFSSLTPAQTKKIAAEYAEKCTPSAKRLAKISHDFAPLKKLKPQEAMEKLAAITLKAKTDSDTFYLGARVLAGAFRQGGIRLDGKKIDLSGNEHAQLRTKLTAKLEKMPKNHPLRKLAVL